MKPSDDFSPIVDQGELEAEGGLFSRLKKRQEMTPIEPGYVRVLLDTNGRPVDQQTAGQKYWSRAARSWVKVDTRSHPLHFAVSFHDPSGLVSFTAEISVVARVTDPDMAVAEGAESVEEMILPPLQKAVRGAHGKKSEIDGDKSAVSVLNDLRLAASDNLESILGDLDDVPDWLSVKVNGVTVELDESTEKHREELITKLREVAIADAGKQSQLAKAEGEIEVWKIWEQGFAGRLADPEMRALKRLAADPSRENIDRVAAEFDQIEAEEREAVVGMFRLAVEKGHFPEDEALMNAIDLMEKQIAKPRAALGRSSEQGQVEAPKEEAEVVEAETVETEPEPKGEPSDTDWDR